MREQGGSTVKRSARQDRRMARRTHTVFFKQDRVEIG
jgi:hypothetical protein